MEKKKRPWAALFLAIFSLIGFVLVILYLPPGDSYNLFGLQISYLFIFFPLLFLCLYGLGAFFLKSAAQGVLIALLVATLLLFRLTQLTNPLFYILLFILFFSMEAVVWKKN